MARRSSSRRTPVRRPRRTAVEEVPARSRRTAVTETPAPARSRRQAVTSLGDAVIAADQHDGIAEVRPDISKAVDQVIRSVQKQHGDDAIERLDETPEAVIGVVPTGLPSLDAVFGIGGKPMAKLVQIVGPESVGKSALAKLLMRADQRAGVVPYFIDGEMSKDTPARYAALGVDTHNVGWTEELYLEDAFAKALTVITAMRRSPTPVTIYLDSIAAFQMKRVAEKVKAGEEFEGTGGRPEKALFLSENLPKLVHAVQGTKIGIVFVNQLRQKARAMPFENPWYEVGGMALRYWCHVILWLKRFGTIRQGDEIIGVKTRVNSKKNKLAPPFGHADLEIMFDGTIREGSFARAEE